MVLLAVGCGSGSAPAEPGAARERVQFITIGTGGVTGVYYQVGGALMQLVNEASSEHGLRAAAQATGGSVYNINAILTGNMEFGLAQSDRQYQALKGLAEWSEQGPQDALRAICSFHPETVTLVAAADSGIAAIQDLRGKRVNIGNPGSGQRGNALDVLRTAGLDPDRDLQAESLKAADSAKVLQDGRIDAFFYTVGHPAGAISEAVAGRRRVAFVPITGMERLLAEAPYYAPATISADMYPGAVNTADVPTISVMTTLVTAASVPDDLVYCVTRTVFTELERLRAAHPALAGLQPEAMVRHGLSAPLHPGAERYYLETGLLPAP
ncbi:MAG: TAXI family TRAP transporter solute-binding subunit [Lentisphaeria bacterium]|nr:TAXI family TRAP transporter solute-binding subunit [Lentisphaeria bacterium]